MGRENGKRRNGRKNSSPVSILDLGGQKPPPSEHMYIGHRTEARSSSMLLYRTGWRNAAEGWLVGWVIARWRRGTDRHHIRPHRRCLIRHRCQPDPPTYHRNHNATNNRKHRRSHAIGGTCPPTPPRRLLSYWK